jgi:phosphoglycolate phosphatase
MNIQLAIFDLDGTLIDSKKDLVDSVNATRAHAGLAPLEDHVVASYVGNGAPVLIRRAFPDVTDEEHARLLRYFLDYYREHMLDATTLYPGVREALDRLHASDVALAVLTNKPVRFSVGLLEGLGVDMHFFRVYGGNSFEQKKPDPIGIRMLMEESGAPSGRTLMVGDSSVDILTARNARVASCGVKWGFQPETFLATPPDYLIADMRELLDIRMP